MPSSARSATRPGAYSPDALAGERSLLEEKLDALTEQEGQSEAAMRALVKDVLKISELLNNLTELYGLATPAEKEQIVRKVSSELLIDENTAQLSPRNGLEPVFRLKISNCEQRSWFSELCSLDFGAAKNQIEAQVRLRR